MFLSQSVPLGSMGRDRTRVCLQDGLSLNLNLLIRRRFISPGCVSGPSLISWTYTYSGEKIAQGLISGDLSQAPFGWLRIQVGTVDQKIQLVRLSRHFGGGQWYFLCPFENRHCSVVWFPNGARAFASRQTWGEQVAYSTQFHSRHNRALAKAQAIRARLGGPDWAGIDEFDPPKPKWMRWRTYNRIVNQSRELESIADERIVFLMKQWGISS